MRLKESRYIAAFVFVVLLVIFTFVLGVTEAYSAQVAEVTVQTLNVRSGPGVSNQRVSTVSQGTFLSIIARQSDWLQVRLPQGGDGWVCGSSGYASLHNVSGNLRVTVDALNVRSGPGVSYTRISQVTKGNLPFLEERNGWYRVVLPQGRAGWISGQYASPISAESGGGADGNILAGAAVVKASTLNVRSGPGTEFGVSAKVQANTVLPVLEEKNNWYRILLPGNKEGWIASWLSEFLAPDNNTSRTAMINVPSLNIRSGPSTGYGILKSGFLGEEFKVINSVSGWLNIIFGNSTAWISANHTLMRNADGSGGSALAGKTIVIDPGHGGSDPGAVGRNYNLTEKFVNLDTALRLARLLENDGAKVVLTRSTDVFIVLSQRVNIAHANNADIFVSIHANAHNDRSIGGTETYYNTSFRSQDSYRLASLLQQEMVRELKLRDIGVKTAGFHVIRNTQVPSALVELAFLSNAREEELLNQASFRQRSAEAVYRGIVRYFQ